MKTNLIPLLTRKTAHLAFAFVCTVAVAAGVGAKLALEQACWGYDQMEDYFRQPSFLFTWKPRVQTNVPAAPAEKPALPQSRPGTAFPIDPAPVLQ